MTEYVINGAKFNSEKGFYNYVESLFTYGLNWKIGRNLDAFNDVLSGGFGKHENDEKIIVRWRNFSKSKSKLNSNFLNIAISILEEKENVAFTKQKH